MLRIEEPVNGQVCNRWDGVDTPEGRQIAVWGVCDADASVTVNGQPAEVRNGHFHASAVLSGFRTEIVARSASGESAEAVVFHDRSARRRFRFSVDDGIWFLRDIARFCDKSIFENGFLSFWRSMHQEFGVRVQVNVYYQDVDTDFTLDEMPDRFRGEWQDNSDWLHLTFHARADRPSSPYQTASFDEVKRDCELVTGHIRRFAGEGVLSDYTTLHFGAATVEGCRALKACGFNGLVGYFTFMDGKPRVSYYVPPETIRHLEKRDVWVDTAEGLTFVKHDLVLDTKPLAEIVPILNGIAADPHQSDLMELLIHEEYFYPRFRLYQPDATLKVRTALQWLTERGYEPVFYDGGRFMEPASGL